MRRPTFCSTFDDDDDTITAPPAPTDKESRLSKMKRILTTTILLGRKGKKDSVHSLATRAQHDFDENEQDMYEKENIKTNLVVELGPSKKRANEELRKCQITKGIHLNSPEQKFDETMDTEQILMNSDVVAICLSKNTVNGNNVKDNVIEIYNNQSAVPTENNLKPRKRKERLDSEGSNKQENKVIRSNSEERPEMKNDEDKDSSIRRVSSHEDFSRVHVLHEINSPALSTVNADKVNENFKNNVFCMEGMFHNPEELEHEKIRSCERFSRAGAPSRERRNLPRRKIKGSRKKFDFGESSELKDYIPKAVAVPERDHSPTPSKESSSPPALDISILHKQMEGSEPITSRGKVLSPEEEPESPSLEVLVSPRNSFVLRMLNSDPSIPPSPPREHNVRHGNYDIPEKKLTKQINSLKKQLKKYEEGFKEEFGYRPSQADKMANKDIKKMCLNLNKLRNQLKQCREDFIVEGTSISRHLNSLASWENACQPSGGTSKHSKSHKTMEEVLQEVEKRLQEKREQSGRSCEIAEMNIEDLLEEKLAVQKALLHLENIFGRPVTKEDRDLVRPLYQRYRSLKRLVIRHAGTKLNNSTSELATILEHEAMEFTNLAPTSFESTEPQMSAPGNLNASAATEPASNNILEDDMQNISSSSDSLAENLHALPLCQLLEQQKCAREEKKRLRRSLKEFEESFQSVAGRRAQKQDRIIIEGIYVDYKQIKAKLRLLDALVAKKSCVKRNSC